MFCSITLVPLAWVHKRAIDRLLLRPILRKPVEVLVTGYLLIGNPHQGVTDYYCHASVSRGMRRAKQESRVASGDFSPCCRSGKLSQ